MRSCLVPGFEACLLVAGLLACLLWFVLRGLKGLDFFVVSLGIQGFVV